MNIEFKYKLNKVLNVLVPLAIISFFIYLIFFRKSVHEVRMETYNTLNYITKAEVKEVIAITSGSQGYEGNKLSKGGHEITYEYPYKGNSYSNTEFIPNETGFGEINEFCSELKVYDKIEIKIDSLNPEIALINIK